MTKNTTSESVSAIAEIIDPAPFNRGAVSRTPDQIKWDLNRENKALRKAERIIEYLRGESQEAKALIDGKPRAEKAPVLVERKCKGCGCDITHKRPNAKFHSYICKDKHWARNNVRATTSSC